MPYTKFLWVKALMKKLSCTITSSLNQLNWSSDNEKEHITLSLFIQKNLEQYAEAMLKKTNKKKQRMCPYR